MKAVIFDLDGTLIDSAPDIHAAANKMLVEIGLDPLDYPTVRSFIGNGVPKLIERVMGARDIPFSEPEHHRLHDIFMRHYNAAPADLTELYPGLTGHLDWLRAQGFTLAVCTNKPEEPTRAILAAFGLTDLFPVVVGGDTLPVKKPDPAPLIHTITALGATEVLYVGDSEVDAETAQAAKIPFAIYTPGYRKSPLDQVHHDYAFDHYDDLQAIVQARFAEAAE